MIKKTIIALTLLFFIITLTSCVTFRLEKQLKKLSPALAEWYEIHSILMETKVPRWIDDRGGKEKVHFLRLPQQMQLAYTTIFWKIRHEGAREEFYNRVAVANKSFSGEGRAGWKTDRGQVLLLCGFPQYLAHYPLISEKRADHSFEGYLYQVWEYYQQGHLVRYVFKYSDPDTWRRDFTINRGLQSNFEIRCKELFAPTEDGWDLWGSLLFEWWRGK